MIAVAGRAIVRHLAFRTVAFHACGFGWHDNFGCVSALGRIMTFHASHAGVLRVVEMRANHPAVGDQRTNDVRHRNRVRAHFVTCGAAVEFRPSIRAFARGGEEHFALEIRSVHELFA